MIYPQDTYTFTINKVFYYTIKKPKQYITKNPRSQPVAICIFECAFSFNRAYIIKPERINNATTIIQNIGIFIQSCAKNPVTAPIPVA